MWQRPHRKLARIPCGAGPSDSDPPLASVARPTSSHRRGDTYVVRADAVREPVGERSVQTWAQDALPNRSNAGANCLNLKGVIAIKLVAAPRYQLRRFATLCAGLQRCRTHLSGFRVSPPGCHPAATPKRLSGVRVFEQRQSNAGPPRLSQKRRLATQPTTSAPCTQFGQRRRPGNFAGPNTKCNTRRLLWIKAFDEAWSSNGFMTIAPPRGTCTQTCPCAFRTPVASAVVNRPNRCDPGTTRRAPLRSSQSSR
jgi:hypothetical protein